MNFIARILLLGSGVLLTAGTPPGTPPTLARPDETTVFTFQTKDGKTAALCRGPQGAYLVYRYGTAAKVELEYPAKLDASSWRKFTYWFYRRGGGAQNSGTEAYHLRFKNKGAQYTLSDQTMAFYNQQQKEEHRREVDIEVVVKGKRAVIVGNPETAVGALVTVTHDNKVKLDERMMIAPL